MTLAPIIGPGVNPRTNSVEENTDEAGGRFARAQGGRALHAGMTRAERVAAGHGSAEDLAAHAEDERRHREWRESEAGRAFFQLAAGGQDLTTKQNQN